MKILIAPQAFKGSLSAAKAAKAIETGVRQVFPKAEVVRLPVADGGDGTLEALVENTNGRMFSQQVTGPLGRPVTAQWGVMGDGKTAVIEMAQASGLALIPPGRRDPRLSTTFGTGQLIKAALNHGFRRIIIGLGGSATNDGGAGMAQALGVRFLDRSGTILPVGGAALANLDSVDTSELYPILNGAEIIAATDVTNPLCGSIGASVVYGPQKGASVEVVKELDIALARYAKVLIKSFGIDVANRPGAGAAGGLGAGLIAFAQGKVKPGIDLICDVLGFEEHLTGVNLIFTGEGRVDYTSVYNKAPIGVAKRAKIRNIPVILLVGSLGRGYQAVYEYGIDAIVCIQDRPMSIRESLRRSYDLLVDATARSLRLPKLSLAP